MPLNRGLNRFSAPTQPGGFPWQSLIHGSGLAVMRPLAAPWNAGLLYLATDTAGGTLYRSTGSMWVACGLGVTGATTTSPAGSGGMVQYEDSGAFGAEAGFAYDATNNQLTVPGLTATEDLILSGTATPAAFGVNQNDWNPTGLATSVVIVVDATSPVNITGIVAQPHGSIRILKNGNASSVTLKASDTGSSAANRFLFTRDYVIPQNGTATIQYHTNRWHLVAFDQGILTVPYGGTGATTLTGYVKGSGTSAFTAAATIPAADYPDFVGAGASHAKGAVPDPGATGHTHQPHVLYEDATWGRIIGLLKGESHVLTSESTASTTNTGLTTAQAVTIILDDACDVTVFLCAVCSHDTVNGSARIVIDLDGTDTDGPTMRCPSATLLYNVSGSVKLSGLSSGSHTFTVQYRTNTGNVTFANRGMMIFQVS